MLFSERAAEKSFYLPSGVLKKTNSSILVATISFAETRGSDTAISHCAGGATHILLSKLEAMRNHPTRVMKLDIDPPIIIQIEVKVNDASIGAQNLR